jgi:hypothetical protein
MRLPVSGIGGRTSMPNEFEGLLCAQTIDSETGGLNEHTRDVTTVPRNMSIKACCAAFDPENDADV